MRPLLRGFSKPEMHHTEHDRLVFREAQDQRRLGRDPERLFM